jgi:hypothetical protein
MEKEDITAKVKDKAATPFVKTGNRKGGHISRIQGHGGHSRSQKTRRPKPKPQDKTAKAKTNSQGGHIPCHGQVKEEEARRKA